ncbi:PIN domain-containing protein [Chloroflexi bacterium TSY]|nr:PIN domain-containing protein [Chloroflexi bacterium TSY]
MQKQRYVIDTTALISYFADIFGRPSRISSQSISLIAKAFDFEDAAILVIPSIVFIEIFDKWFRGQGYDQEEFRAKFLSEVYKPILAAPNMEVRELDQEVLESFLSLDDPNINLENHDKIVLSTAMVLNANLVTSDQNIKRYVSRYKVVPNILS